MWKKYYPVIIMTLIVTIICLLLVPSPPDASAHGPLTSYDKGVLDRWYFQTNSTIHGDLIIDGTISTSKLDFAVVPYEDWTNHLSLFFLHTNNSAAHHTRFSNNEETDQVFTNWLDTSSVVLAESDPVHTNWIATNTYTKFNVGGELLITNGGWANVAFADTGTWYTVSGYDPSLGDLNSFAATRSNLTYVGQGTAHCSIVSTVGSDVDGSASVEYDIFINGAKTHAVNGIFRDHSGAGTRGSVTVARFHDFVNGDTVSTVARRQGSAVPSRTMDILGGSIVINGWVE